MPEAEVEERGPIEFVLFTSLGAAPKLSMEKATVSDLLKLPGTSQVVDTVKILDGELKLYREDEGMRWFEGRVKFGQRVGSTKVEGFQNVTVFQDEKGHAIALMCPSFASDALAAVLSMCTFGYPFGLRRRRISKDDFMRLWEYATSIGGTPREVHVRMIGNKVSIYHVTGQDILGTAEIGDPRLAMEKAKRIKRLGFSFPPNYLTDSPLHFWVADWGGGTIYEPLQFLPHHAIALLNFFEKALRITSDSDETQQLESE